MSLVGKFVFHSGAEYFHWGEIIDQITPEVVLIQFQTNENIPPSAVAFRIHDLVTEMASDGTPDADWQFFSTKRELDAYMEWLFKVEEGPEAGSNVVRLQ